MLPPSPEAIPCAAARFRTGRAIAWLLFALALLGLFAEIALKTPLRERLTPALLVTLAFAVIARILGGVTYSGAAAGFVASSLLFLSCGPVMFGAVLLVFVVTLLATKFGRSRKQLLAIAERSGGRDGAQVLANVGIPAVFAALSAITPVRTPLIAASLAALAEAACDTVSSETGKALSPQARLVTSGRIVSAGTDGAVSISGTFMGSVAAALVGLEAFIGGLLDLRRAIAVVVAGTLGMLLDSVLGATLERRGWLTNNAVNLVSTIAAALLAMIAAW